MQYRTDIKTGNNLSVLGFGCMRFPKILGRIDLKKTEEIVMRSIEMGVNYFDSAWMYSGSEETLGAIFKKNNVREKIYIATKLPLVLLKSSGAGAGNRARNTAAEFDKYLNQSLERLQTDYIDYYLLHMLMDFDQWQKLKNNRITEWIAQKKKSGAVRQIGFSFHGSGSEFLKIIEDYDWDICLIQYNYFDENFQAGVTGLRAAAKKMPVIIMEPLLGGKLAAGLPKEAVNIFRKHDSALSPAGWALNWLWDQTEVTALISGMGTLEQLEENARLASSAKAGMLTDQYKAVYNSVLKYMNRSCKVRCTGCNYCMPCPAGVNIPGCFSAYNTRYSMGFVEGMKQFATSTGMVSETGSSPGQCIKCGKCEPLCPQKVSIIKELAIVRRRMEPWWIKLGGACARAFFGRKRQKSQNLGIFL